MRLGMLTLVALALAGVWTLNARASTGQQAEAPAHPAPASDTGRQVSMGGERDAASAVLASDCRRPESEPSHLPDDLRDCKFPNKTDQFGTAPWTRKLVNNPYEPGCWDRTSYCAPFECFPQCRYNVEYQNMITYWAPFRPGKRKVMVFQYGKVASTAIVRGLKLYAGITAAHVHTADHAKQWLAGRHVDLPVEQQGFALSEEWSLRSGPCAQHGQRYADCVFSGPDE